MSRETVICDMSRVYVVYHAYIAVTICMSLHVCLYDCVY